MSRYVDPRYELYTQQIRNASRRGVNFELTFPQWLEWWGEDLLRRGNRRNDLVMARLGDKGPYALGNIEKLTCAENRRRGTFPGPGAGRKVRVKVPLATNRGYQQRWPSYRVQTPVGDFPSVKAAAVALGVTPPAVKWRVERKHEGYRYFFEPGDWGLPYLKLDP